MRRWAALAAAVLLAAACSSPERWQERGFESEADCWLNHGWDGTVADGANRKTHFDYWCGPITDG